MTPNPSCKKFETKKTLQTSIQLIAASMSRYAVSLNAQRSIDSLKSLVEDVKPKVLNRTPSVSSLAMEQRRRSSVGPLRRVPSVAELESAVDHASSVSVPQQVSQESAIVVALPSRSSTPALPTTSDPSVTVDVVESAVDVYEFDAPHQMPAIVDASQMNNSSRLLSNEPILLLPTSTSRPTSALSRPGSAVKSAYSDAMRIYMKHHPQSHSRAASAVNKTSKAVAKSENNEWSAAFIVDDDADGDFGTSAQWMQSTTRGPNSAVVLNRTPSQASTQKPASAAPSFSIVGSRSMSNLSSALEHVGTMATSLRDESALGIARHLQVNAHTLNKQGHRRMMDRLQQQSRRAAGDRAVDGAAAELIVRAQRPASHSFSNVGKKQTMMEQQKQRASSAEKREHRAAHKENQQQTPSSARPKSANLHLGVSALNGSLRPSTARSTKSVVSEGLSTILLAPSREQGLATSASQKLLQRLNDVCITEAVRTPHGRPASAATNAMHPLLQKNPRKVAASSSANSLQTTMSTQNLKSPSRARPQTAPLSPTANHTTSVSSLNSALSVKSTTRPSTPNNPFGPTPLRQPLQTSTSTISLNSTALSTMSMQNTASTGDLIRHQVARQQQAVRQHQHKLFVNHQPILRVNSERDLRLLTPYHVDAPIVTAPPVIHSVRVADVSVANIASKAFIGPKPPKPLWYAHTPAQIEEQARVLKFQQLPLPEQQEQLMMQALKESEERVNDAIEAVRTHTVALQQSASVEVEADESSFFLTSVPLHTRSIVDSDSHSTVSHQEVINHALLEARTGIAPRSSVAAALALVGASAGITLDCINYDQLPPVSTDALRDATRRLGLDEVAAEAAIPSHPPAESSAPELVAAFEPELPTQSAPVEQAPVSMSIQSSPQASHRSEIVDEAVMRTPPAAMMLFSRATPTSMMLPPTRFQQSLSPLKPSESPPLSPKVIVSARIPTARSLNAAVSAVAPTAVAPPVAAPSLSQVLGSPSFGSAMISPPMSPMMARTGSIQPGSASHFFDFVSSPQSFSAPLQVSPAVPSFSALTPSASSAPVGEIPAAAAEETPVSTLQTSASDTEVRVIPGPSNQAFQLEQEELQRLQDRATETTLARMAHRDLKRQFAERFEASSPLSAALAHTTGSPGVLRLGPNTRRPSTAVSAAQRARLLTEVVRAHFDTVQHTDHEHSVHTVLRDASAAGGFALQRPLPQAHVLPISLTEQQRQATCVGLNSMPFEVPNVRTERPRTAMVLSPSSRTSQLASASWPAAPVFCASGSSTGVPVPTSPNAARANAQKQQWLKK